MVQNRVDQCVIAVFLHDEGEICSLLGYYALYSGNSLPVCRYNLSVPSSRVMESKVEFLGLWGNPRSDFLALKDGTDGLFRNVGEELPIYDV